jgi:hypothetical protein
MGSLKTHVFNSPYPRLTKDDNHLRSLCGSYFVDCDFQAVSVPTGDVCQRCESLAKSRDIEISNSGDKFTRFSIQHGDSIPCEYN